jgi:hypothetical protein
MYYIPQSEDAFTMSGMVMTIISKRNENWVYSTFSNDKTVVEHFHENSWIANHLIPFGWKDLSPDKFFDSIIEDV